MMINNETCALDHSENSLIESVVPGMSAEKQPNGTLSEKTPKKSPTKAPPEGAGKQGKSPKNKNKSPTAELLEADLAKLSLAGVAETSVPGAEPTVPCSKTPSSSPANLAATVIGQNSSKSPLGPQAPPATSCTQSAKPIPTAKQPSSLSALGKPMEKANKRNRDDKLRKKDDKSVEHVLKALSSLETTEEKLGAMCQKYAEIVNEHRLLQNAAKLCEKKNSILQKEKEQLQADHSKAILTRSRLENLCRELQRQNKAVKEECMLKIREEEEKKREVASKFQSTLTELGNLLAQNNDKNAKLRDDNLDMTTKLKSVCEQYERKEQHVEKLAKQMQLEMQLADAKLAKEKMERAMDKETQLREKQQLLLDLSQAQAQMEDMRLSETALRNQIQLYNDKYDEFHKALLQSNEAIGGFKQEMERMSKQIRKLEKETVSWKSRYEAAHRTLLQMTEEKLKSDQNAAAANRKLVALQSLCRSLQAQCTTLRNEIKGGEPSRTLERSDQEDELMNQVEKELCETTPDEGLTSDASPCPRQLSRESAEKTNGETPHDCADVTPPTEPHSPIDDLDGNKVSPSPADDLASIDPSASTIELNGNLSENSNKPCGLSGAAAKKNKPKKKNKK